jgi:hypothetical protein
MRRAGDVDGTRLYYRVIRRCSRQALSGNMVNVWQRQGRVTLLVSNARLIPGGRYNSGGGRNSLAAGVTTPATGT